MTTKTQISSLSFVAVLTVFFSACQEAPTPEVVPENPIVLSEQDALNSSPPEIPKEESLPEMSPETGIEEPETEAIFAEEGGEMEGITPEETTVVFPEGGNFEEGVGREFSQYEEMMQAQN